MQDPTSTQGRPIPFGVALLPILFLVGLLCLVFLILPKEYEGFEGSGHIPLLLSACFAAIVARYYGHRWRDLEDGIVTLISRTLGALLILYAIGLLIASWVSSGVVPALIRWGLDILAPEYFLPASCLICAVVSLVSGSSWTTAGTVGVALIGIGNALGIDPGMTAGAIVSGAYFGDKLSPMSETTNLAPAMAGTNLFTHIGHLLYTTIPAMILALGGYIFLSVMYPPSEVTTEGSSLGPAISELFDPSWIHLLPPVIVVVLVIRKMPALPSLLAGTLVGCLVAIFRQGESIPDMFGILLSGYVPPESVQDQNVRDLLTRGGMESMNTVVLLVICAMSFGGVMEKTGMLQVIAGRLLSMAKSAGSLIFTTVLTCLGINIVTADQYISIVVPGRMYAAEFRRRGIHPKNLSRTLEDSGTITSPLIPWNSCGAYMASALGVATGAYWMFAFFNLLNPLIALFYGFTGLTIHKIKPEEIENTA